MQPPLRIPYDLITDIADRADASTYGRMVRGDLAFCGIEAIASGKPGILWKPHIDRLNAFLADRTAERTEAIRRHVLACDEGTLRISQLMVDPVTRGLIDDRGCSVAAIAMLYRMANQITLTADDIGDDRIYVEVTGFVQDSELNQRLNLDFELGGGVSWSCDRVRLQHGLPESLGATLAGRGLREVVSHPVLDRHDITITGWDGEHLFIEMHEPSTSVYQ